MISNTYTSSGGSSWHYDQALSTGSGLIATGWVEL